MNSEIKLGRINTLKIDRKSVHGLFLVALDGDDVLLPKAYVNEDMKLDESIKVFVYNDSEDRYVATTEFPKAKLGEFAYMEVVDVTNFGAFINWGLPKDLLVPKKYQRIPLEVGMKFVFRVCLDEESDRLIGVHKYNEYLKNDPKDLGENEQISLIVREKTPLGFKVIVNNAYDGMIFHNEIFEDIWIGQKKLGYVKNIRADKKLDISLQPVGKDRYDMALFRVKKVLSEHDGKLGFTYKSAPEEIKKMFGLSKKDYKYALGRLIENKEILLGEEGISLA